MACPLEKSRGPQRSPIIPENCSPTIARMNRATSASRVRRCASSRSSHTPIMRSSTTFIAAKTATTRVAAGSRRIGESVGHAEDVRRGEAQRKAERAPEIKLHGERRHHHRKEMPGEKNSPEKKAEQIQAILCRNEIGAHGDARARTENEQGGKQ